MDYSVSFFNLLANFFEPDFGHSVSYYTWRRLGLLPERSREDSRFQSLCQQMSPWLFPLMELNLILIGIHLCRPQVVVLTRWSLAVFQITLILCMTSLIVYCAVHNPDGALLCYLVVVLISSVGRLVADHMYVTFRSNVAVIHCE